MTDKIFVVTHPHARVPLTIEGKTLSQALKKEGLDPTIWRLQDQPDLPSEETFGKDN